MKITPGYNPSPTPTDFTLVVTPTELRCLFSALGNAAPSPTSRVLYPAIRDAMKLLPAE